MTINLTEAAPQLPAWPESLPAPTVTLDFPLDIVETYVSIEGEKARFWRWGGQDHISNSYDHGHHFSANDRPWLFLSDEDLSAAIEWGAAVQDRAEHALADLGVPVEAGTATATLVLAYATGERNTVAVAPVTAVAGLVRFDQVDAAALPVLPEGMPEPEVAFTYPNGLVATEVTIGGETVKFWRWKSGVPLSNSADLGRAEVWESLGSKGRKAALAWGAAVQKRAEAAVAAAGVSVAGSVAGELLAFATGRELGPVSRADMAAARVDAAMEIWPVNEDGVQGRVHDVLTDLRHFCKVNGVDLEEVLRDSVDTFVTECADPFFGAARG
jgi:hypothetical protein